MGMIQVRNVPEDLHRELKSRASRAGMTLSDYLLRELGRIVGEPPVDVLLDAIRERGRIPLDHAPASVIRGMRDGGGV